MELFKTLNILPVPCMYIMEIVYNVKLNINRLEQNSDRHISVQAKDQVFDSSFVESIFKKKKKGVNDTI
jgi:hypothetical protein